MIVDRWYSPHRDYSWYFNVERPRRERRPLGVPDMVLVERDLDRCGYRTPWASQVCGENHPCPEHAELTCTNGRCNNPAVNGCHADTMSLICGAPVCSDHHNCGRHW